MQRSPLYSPKAEGPWKESFTLYGIITAVVLLACTVFSFIPRVAGFVFSCNVKVAGYPVATTTSYEVSLSLKDPPRDLRETVILITSTIITSPPT